MHKCPHCPAEYSTDEELQRHAEALWYHYPERLRIAEDALRGVAKLVGPRVRDYRSAVERIRRLVNE